ncbi:Ig-like domain-containing protein [Acetobacterium bakii]|uniref:Ig-like domain-containing protein n=1 Tax=Acetobacterium bakii TaxID=52689 RepID=UPI00068142FA|nr:Ig-like domain-containing protein [Acetobacterium bakii]
MKKNSIIAIVLILLILVTAILFVRGCEQQSSEIKTYGVAGTYTEKATYKNAEITVPGVTIENATFTGNVLVGESVGEGDVHFTASEVKGELLIQGGGDAIYINGGSYQQITVDKLGVKLVLLGDAKVETLTARQPCIIIATENSYVKNMIVEKTAGRTSIISQDSAIIENIQAQGPADIVLNTPTKTVSFGPDAVGSILETNAVVDKIETEARVELNINANVGALLLTGAGKGTVVTLGNNAVIAAIGTDALVVINGEGSITAATTNNAANLTGSVVPDVIYTTAKPVVTDPKGGYMVSTSTVKTTSSGSSTLNSWSGSGSSNGFTSSSEENSSYRLIVPAEIPGVLPAPPALIVPGTIGVASVAITPVSSELLMGNTLALTATVLPENAANKTVSWESSDTRIATVANGLVTPITNGDVSITARTQDGSKTAVSNLSVKTNITAVMMIDTITAVNNTISKTIDYNASNTLPVVVIAQGYGTETFPVSVNWTPTNADTKKVGETTYLGTLTLPGGYLNTDAVQPVIQLTVKPQPIITVTSLLTSQRIYLNGDPSEFKAVATVTEGKTLSYQWSQTTKDINGIDVNTTLAGATGASYDPPVSTTPGTIYYYCDITAENAAPVKFFAGTVVTGPTAANPAALAELPAVTTQPIAIASTPLSAPMNLSVTASVVNGGSLSYQWFEQTKAVNAEGTAIPGATGATLSTTAKAVPGTTYYYAEITNTQADTSAVTAVSLPVSVIVN